MSGVTHYSYWEERDWEERDWEERDWEERAMNTLEQNYILVKKLVDVGTR